MDWGCEAVSKAFVPVCYHLQIAITGARCAGSRISMHVALVAVISLPLMISTHRRVAVSIVSTGTSLWRRAYNSRV
jgi:H+/gluconate symporter-like permease